MANQRFPVSHRDTKKNSSKSGRQPSNPSLARIAHVGEPEQSGKHNGGGPEPDTAGERELRITADKEFLEKSHHEKRGRPEDAEI